MKDILKKRNNLISIPVVIAVYAIIYVLNRVGILNSYLLQLVMVTCINIIMTTSLNLINGFAGQFSIGHAGFMAIGAYSSAVFTTLIIPRASVPGVMQIPFFLLVLVISGIITGAVGFLLSFPSLRLKGDYLAIVTLSFGEIIRAIIRMIPAIGGPRGMPAIPPYANFTVIFFVTLFLVLLVRNVAYSTHGRAFISIRENEIAAETLGVNVFRFKVMAFTISSFCAGIGGALFSHLMTYIHPDQFSMLRSTDYLVFLYAGGTASISGSLVSSALLTILPEMLRFLNDWRVVIYAVLLIFIMLRRPNGLYGGKEFPFLRVKNY